MLNLFSNFLNKGYAVVPTIPKSKLPGWDLAGPRPLHDWPNWSMNVPQQRLLERARYGVSLLTGKRSGVIAIDIDSDELRQQIESILPEAPGKIGARGVTYFYSYSGEATRKWNVNGRVVIELLSDGRHTVLPPSIHPNGESYKWIQEKSLLDPEVLLRPLPVSVMETLDAFCRGLEQPGQSVSESETKNFSSSCSNVTNHGCLPSLQELKKFISFSLADDYQEWLETGMAIKQSYGTESLPIWDEWSKSSSKYKEGECEKKWASFKRKDLTVSTIIQRAYLRGFRAETEEPIPDNISRMVSKAKGKTTKRQEVVKEKPIPIEFPHGLVGEVARWITETAPRPQPELAIAAALNFIGALKGHRVQTVTGLRTNLYLLGIAPSGSGKDYPMKAVESLAAACGVNDLMCGKPASYVAFTTLLKKNGGVRLLQFDEIGRWLESYGANSTGMFQKNITTILLELFSKANSVYRGSEYANHDGKQERIDIDQPHVCILGVSNPDSFYAGMQSRQCLDGFLARFLTIEVSNADPEIRLLPKAEPPKDIIDQCREILACPVNIEKRGNLDARIIPRTIPFSENILPLIKEYDAKKKASRGTGLDSLYARAFEHIAKIALTIAGTNKCINSADVAWARSFVDHCITTLESGVRKYLADTNTERDMKFILSLLEDCPEGMRRREFLRKSQRMDKGQRDKVLSSLIEDGRVSVVNEPTKSTNKLASSRYFITGE